MPKNRMPSNIWPTKFPKSIRFSFKLIGQCSLYAIITSGKIRAFKYNVIQAELFSLETKPFLLDMV